MQTAPRGVFLADLVHLPTVLCCTKHCTEQIQIKIKTQMNFIKEKMQIQAAPGGWTTFDLIHLSTADCCTFYTSAALYMQFNS